MQHLLRKTKGTRSSDNLLTEILNRIQIDTFFYKVCTCCRPFSLNFMPINYLQFTFRPVTKVQQEILIAQLSDVGFEGFEEGSDQLQAFIPEDRFQEEYLTQLQGIDGVETSRVVVPPTNWNAEWEKNFEPVVVHQFCAVRAHFHAPIPDVRYEVIITPKMSFGTGHHATTWMMIDWMEALQFTGKSILDFGTGTGILAILAEFCGGTEITAIDNDDWSIENAAENISINQCKAIELYKADALHMKATFDLILANINKNVLLGNMAAIRQHLAPGGVVIMSGLLSGDRQDIETEAIKHQLKITGQKDRQNWIALQLTAADL